MTDADSWIKVPLNDIVYVDHPEIDVDEHEKVQMPFRYVRGADGRPVIPQVGRLDAYSPDNRYS